MRTLISFAALFLSVALLQLSSGAISPLDALGGLKSGFTTTEVGLLGSSHFPVSYTHLTLPTIYSV